uniref:Uncharacterized protein LOC111110654 n=1 Tax=Crassostrea virginica TaxID=6565 RepID=A0A8B8BJE1_CRAVI|nr:uncharacterized protein LOC111110654 [Crassostrea virginica]
MTMRASTLCNKIRFDGLQQQNTTIECNTAMVGNTIILKRTDKGYLRLFELYPIVCLPNHYGPFCAKCKKKCQSCDSITGRCTQCPPSFHGEECQYNCPLDCLDLICNQGTGICNGCQNGYEGQRCEQEIITTVVSTDSKTGDNDYYWALLSCMLVLLTILVFVVIILFSRRKRQISRRDKDEDISIFSEHQRGINDTTNGLDLEEIPQNETGDIAEEVITVEYMNLTSQRVSINQFVKDLPNRNEDEILEKEFDELPYGMLESYSNALKSANRNKSRFKGIFPYDYNGVRLNTEFENNEDFVNASYIHHKVRLIQGR